MIATVIHRSIAIVAMLCFVGTAHAAGLPLAEPLPVKILQNNVAYVQLGSLTAAMTDAIRPTMDFAASKKARGIVLDLRGNQGGDIGPVYALFDALLPKGTPFMRHILPTYRRIDFTTQLPVIKKSTPVVVIRDAGTSNEADIVVYILQKLRGAGIVEFTPTRAALKKTFKQQARMDQYRPIKEAVFFVTPDVRLIKSEGAGQEDVISRAINYVREMSPWGETKK